MIPKFLKVLSFLFCLVILSSLPFNRVFATSQFNEDFSYLDNWDVISNGSTNSWIVSDNKLYGLVGRQGNSFLLFKNLNFGKNFELVYEAKNNSGIDQELLFRVDKDTPEFYVINTRFYEPNWTEDDANEVVIWKCFSLKKNSCSEVSRNSELNFTLNKNQFYSFRLVVNNKNIDFYIDGQKIIDQTFINDYIGGIGFWSWGGDYEGGVSNIYKNFSITSYDYNFPTPIETPTPTLVLTPTPTITPTPSPIPTSIPIPTATPTEVVRKKKIFILPGLGASWNSKAIVYGQSVGDNEWEMTPFVNNYNGVIELMEKNGLEKDKDYFVWNYDWRKNIANIETDFDEYVKSKNLSSGDDIYLIGHSLGGVVARLWAQDNNSENVKKIIELGSPNLGSLDSYSVWNGGKIMKSSGLSSVAFNIILGLQNKGFVLTDLNKIRNFVPIVKDLLPVFDYAVKGSKTMSWNTMESHNDFLNSQNVNVSILGSKLKFFVGVGVSTPSKVSLVNRSFVSKTLGLWPDGEIKDYIYSNGDGTVLSTSVNMGLSNFLEFNSTHGEIVAKSISEVADEIGFLNKSISFGYSDNFSDGLVIFVGSPVTSFLKCGSETYQEDDGFIVVKNKNYGDCELNLSPTDNGVVHVVLGNTSTNKWNYFEKEVTLNNPEKIKIDYKKAGIKIDASNKQVLKDQIKSDLEKLGLNKAIKFLDKNDFGKVAWYIFEYRKQNNERIVSQRVLNNLFIYGSIISPDRIKGNYKWLGMYIDLVDKTLEVKSKRKNISQNSISSLVWLKNLEDSISGMIKDKKYPDYQLTAMMVFGYGGEAVRN
jgi:hypothetical protein